MDLLHSADGAPPAIGICTTRGSLIDQGWRFNADGSWYEANNDSDLLGFPTRSKCGLDSGKAYERVLLGEVCMIDGRGRIFFLWWVVNGLFNSVELGLVFSSWEDWDSFFVFLFFFFIFDRGSWFLLASFYTILICMGSWFSLAPFLHLLCCRKWDWEKEGTWLDMCFFSFKIRWRNEESNMVFFSIKKDWFDGSVFISIFSLAFIYSLVDFSNLNFPSPKICKNKNRNHLINYYHP